MSPLRVQLLAIGLLGISAGVWVATPSEVQAESCGLVFPKGTQFDVGELPAGSHEVSFEVRNDGEHIVGIKEISGSCTCMSIDFPGSQIQPGETKVCTVELNVQPNASLTGAIFIQTEVPVAERYSLFITYRGVQDDLLELTRSLDVSRLGPDEQVELELDCLWKSSAEIAGDAFVSWSLHEPVGIELVEHHEMPEGESGLRSVGRFRVDARGLSAVEARLEVAVGMPVRAKVERTIRIPVLPSVVVEPDVIMVTDRAELERGVLARVRVDRSEGWRIDEVESPEWLAAELQMDELRLEPIVVPAESRGVHRVRLSSSHPDGARAERTVRIVLDLENDE